MSLVDDLADLNVQDNWIGGEYQLAFELGPRDDDRLDDALSLLWQTAGVEGCFEAIEGEPGRHRPTELTLVGREGGGVRGLVRIPSGAVVVCGACSVRLDAGIDWLDLFLPFGALANTDPRIGGYPFGDDGGPASLAWRKPLDDWLLGLAKSVADSVAFRLALAGFDASGAFDAESARRGIPKQRHFALLVVGNDGLSYYPATQ